MERKFPERLLKVVLISENSEKFCTIRHWNFPEIQTGIFHRMESAPEKSYAFRTTPSYYL